MFFMIRKHIILHIESLNYSRTRIQRIQNAILQLHLKIIAFKVYEDMRIKLFSIFHTRILFLFLELVFLSLTLINIHCRVLWSESKSWDGICLDINISECVSTMVWSPCPSLPKRDSTLMLRMKSNSQCLSSQPHTSTNIWRQYLEVANLKKEPPIWNQPQQFIIIKMVLCSHCFWKILDH